MSTVIAGLAVVVAALGMLVTWRQQQRVNQAQDAMAALQRGQVDLQNRLAAIEIGRRRDELKPRLSLVFDRQVLNGQRCPRLEVTNQGPLDYQRLVLELRDVPPVVRGIGAEAVVTTEAGSLLLGETLVVMLAENKVGRGGPLKAWATCYAEDGESWRVLLSCDVPAYARVGRA